MDIRRIPARVFCVALLLLAACGTDATLGARPAPSGPPTIDYDLVRQHALQFDVDIPSRPPGSQHELAAATYILGHLQLAGYSPTLAAVPVADQVQSTNVVAFPPNGENPEVLVAIGYDDSGRGAGEGQQIGLFLELARAINVAEPDHRAGFVALGAETDDYAGSVELGRTLEERGFEPQLLLLQLGNEGGGYAAGACASQQAYEIVSDIDDCLEGFQYDWLESSTRGMTRIEGTSSALGDSLLGFLATTAE